MADLRPTVLVTELEYRKAEATFSSAAELRCVPAPADEADLAMAIRDAGAVAVIVGGSVYNGQLYSAMPAGGVIARFGVGHDGIDKNKATMGGLCAPTHPACSIGRWPNRRCC